MAKKGAPGLELGPRPKGHGLRETQAMWPFVGSESKEQLALTHEQRIINHGRSINKEIIDYQSINAL